MNDFHNHADNDRQRLLDQLVDGELSEDERRVLLESMDATPNAWRQCALTFLESQAFQQVLPTVGSCDATDEPSAVLRAHGGVNPKTGIRSVGAVFTLAASVLVAFGLGFVIRGSSDLDPSADLNPSTPPMLVDSPSVVEKPEAPVSEHDASLVEERDIAKDEVPQLDIPMEQAPVWRNVALALNDTESGKGVEWPMAEGEAIDLQWLYNQPSALPREIVEQFEQLGHEVHVVREMLPVRLRDGRQGIVPVDHVELRYVGTNSYQ